MCVSVCTAIEATSLIAPAIHARNFRFSFFPFHKMFYSLPHSKIVSPDSQANGFFFVDFCFSRNKCVQYINQNDIQFVRKYG